MDLLKSLKDVRRRGLETILEVAGQSEKTVDEEYDQLVSSFHDMVKDLKECDTTTSTLLNHQKQFFSDALLAAKCVNKLYEKNENADLFPHFVSELSQDSRVRQYLDAMRLIQDVYSSSANMVMTEVSLGPLRGAVASMEPDVNEVCAKRNELLIDYDAYRRRLHAAKDKLEKNRDAPSVKKDEYDAEVVKLTNKEEQAHKAYHEMNDQAKKNILESRRAHDRLLEMHFITMITCQAALFSRISEHLNYIVQSLPQDKVNQVRDHLDVHIVDEENRVPKPVTEKSTIAKAMNMFTGKQQFSETKATDTLPPPTPAPTPTNQKKYAVALYNYKAEDPRELSFKEGETIEILSTGDNSWWTGKTKNGAVGMFPINHVRVTQDSFKF